MDTTRNVIRWGIIGCGDVTEVKSGPAFQKARGSQLVVVMRRDAEKAADYARRHGVPRSTADADSVINAPDVDALYIATPPGAHEDYALKVAAAGKPCYVEKPMARNAAEAQRMVAAFRQRNVPLFVAYYRRALPRFLKVKELLDDAAIGPLTRISYRYADPQMREPPPTPIPWRLQPEHAGGGLFLDLGSHALDLLDFWFGPLDAVDGQAKNVLGHYPVEDQVRIRFRAAGAPGEASWTFIDDQRHDLYEFTGQLGTLSVPCFADAPVTARWNDGRSQQWTLPHPPHVHQPLVQQVVDQLLARGHCSSTGDSGLRTQTVMDQALASLYGGREDGFWRRRPA